MWDIFISHAWEDKETVARPLAGMLRQAGLTVWYDEFTLTLGDSLRRSIDNGLAQSRYGIVVLSPSFFSKEWPQRELDGLAAREIDSGKVILPIWHNVTRVDVLNHSPVLADRLAVSTSRGLAIVLEEILRVAASHRAVSDQDPSLSAKDVKASAPAKEPLSAETQKNVGPTSFVADLARETHLAAFDNEDVTDPQNKRAAPEPEPQPGHKNTATEAVKELAVFKHQSPELPLATSAAADGVTLQAPTKRPTPGKSPTAKAEPMASDTSGGVSRRRFGIGVVLTGLMLVILAGVLWYFNKPGAVGNRPPLPTESPSSTKSDLPNDQPSKEFPLPKESYAFGPHYTLAGSLGRVHDSLCCVVFVPKSNNILVGFRHRIELWNIASRRKIRDEVILGEKSDWIEHLAANPDGTTFAFAETFGRVTIVDVSTGKPIRDFNQSDSLSEGGLAYSTNGELLATQGFLGNLMVQDSRTGSILLHIKDNSLPGSQHGAGVYFSADGRWLAAAASSFESNGYVQLWNTDDWQLSQKLAIGDTNDLIFSRDDRRVLIGTSNHWMGIWDVAHGNQIKGFRAPDEPKESWNVEEVTMDTTEHWITTRHKDAAIRFWELDTARLASTILPRSACNPVLNSISVTPLSFAMSSSSDFLVVGMGFDFPFGENEENILGGKVCSEVLIWKRAS